MGSQGFRSHAYNQTLGLRVGQRDAPGMYPYDVESSQQLLFSAACEGARRACRAVEGSERQSSLEIAASGAGEWRAEVELRQVPSRPGIAQIHGFLQRAVVLLQKAKASVGRDAAAVSGPTWNGGSRDSGSLRILCECTVSMGMTSLSSGTMRNSLHGLLASRRDRVVKSSEKQPGALSTWLPEIQSDCSTNVNAVVMIAQVLLLCILLLHSWVCRRGLGVRGDNGASPEVQRSSESTNRSGFPPSTVAAVSATSSASQMFPSHLLAKQNQAVDVEENLKVIRGA